MQELSPIKNPRPFEEYTLTEIQDVIIRLFSLEAVFNSTRLTFSTGIGVSNKYVLEWSYRNKHWRIYRRYDEPYLQIGNNPIELLKELRLRVMIMEGT